MPTGIESPLAGFGGSSFLGAFGPQYVLTVVGDNEPKPKLGEATGPQGSLYSVLGGPGNGGFGFGGGGFGGGWGGNEDNPAWGVNGQFNNPYNSGFGTGFGCGGGSGFAGFGTGWPGTYNNYRLLLQHPTVQLARSIVFGCIKIGHWNYIIEKDTPKEIVDWYMKYFPRLRQQFLENNLRALDYGWFPNECIWELDGDLICLKDLKPLQIDFCQILIDIKGNFAGLRQNLMAGGIVPMPIKGNPKEYQNFDLVPNKSHIYSYDCESGRLYGRARLENVRRAVGDWYTTNDHVERLSRKATGLILMLKVPPGGPADKKINPSTRLPYTWADKASALCAEIVGGTGTGFIVAENAIGLTLKNDGTGRMKADAIQELAKASFWDFSTVDLGDNGPMLIALTGNMSYKDKLIFRGYLCPERSGMQGEHGTQEDAGQHTDTGSATINATHDDITNNFNELSEKALVWNFGDKYRHAIHAEAVHVNDIQENIDKMIVQGAMANKDVAMQIFSQYDIGEVFHRRGIPKRDTPLKIVTDDSSNGDSSNGSKPANGNGRITQPH